MDSIKDQHASNQVRLQAIRDQVGQAVSPPPVASSPLVGSPPSSTSLGPPPATGSAKDKLSPSNIASQLFSRGKSKSSSSSSKKKKKGSGSNTPTAPQGGDPQLVKAMEKEVQSIKQDETKLVSSAIGINKEGEVLNETGDDDVLDLADQLLAQLDAKDVETGQSRPPNPTASPNLSTTAPVPMPQPVSASSRTTTPNTGNASLTSLNTLQIPSSGAAATSSSSPSPSSPNSSTRKLSIGAKLKEAFSPSNSSPSDSTTPNGSAGAAGVPHKNRHALKKEKKKAQEDAMRAEAQAEVEAARANGQRDPAHVERLGIEQICRQWHLEMIEMDPDGHCMYSAIADQLKARKVIKDKKLSYTDTRKAAATYMRDHMDEFLPYLPAEDEEGQGEGLLSPAGYAKRCDAIENTAEWGSETEILAISRYYQVPIHIIQAGSPAVKVGHDEPYGKKAKEPLLISYHRRMYGLGEHYNSLRAVTPQSGLVHLG